MRLTLVTDRRLCGGEEGLVTRVEEALRGGVTAVQLREKDLDGGALRALAADLARLCRRAGATFLVNDRIDVALAVDADGVQLPGVSFRVAEARQLLGPGKLIGVSTHDPTEVTAAAQSGASFAVFGPIYATPSKAAYGEPQGIERLRQICATTTLPIVAIGGIDAARAAEVGRAGAAGIAVVSAILSASSARDAAREFLVAPSPGKP